MVISIAILLGWQYFFGPKPPVKGAETPAAVSGQAATPAAPAAIAPAASAAPLAPPVPAAVATTVTLRNDLTTVTLTSAGGRVEGVVLEKYRDAPGPSGKPLVLLPGESDGSGYTTLPVFAPSKDVIFSVAESTPEKVVFAWQSPSGARLEKTFVLEQGRYDLSLKVTVSNQGSSAISDRLVFSTVGDYSNVKSSSYIFQGPSYLAGEKLTQTDPDDADGKTMTVPPVAWAGLTDKYFMVVLAPENETISSTRVAPAGDVKNVVSVDIETPVFDLAPGQAKSFTGRLYIGPKDKKIIEPLGLKLELAIDYGWFNFIGRPMITFLNWIYGLVGNYGVAILILTAFIKGIFWPLTAKSYQSMARMKEIQPKMEKLREKYGDDPQKLNREMMHLYKTHKVNPLSGCLPMLVQIPVFIALYRVLLYAIELRHAPFVWWLQDLSAPDPYYITPVVMGLSMFFQQKMTPAGATNEMQRKLMLYGLPVLFTWLFKDFPSGLVVYWLLNNLISIAQQGMQLRRNAKPA